jgi:hypothetical protein
MAKAKNNAGKSKGKPAVWQACTEAVREQRAEYHGAKAGEIKCRVWVVNGVKLAAVGSVVEHGGADQPRAVRGTVAVGTTEASKSQLLRYCGYTGWPLAATAALFAKLGFDGRHAVPRNSLYSQWYDGVRARKGLPPIRSAGKDGLPAFTKGEKAALEAARKQLTPAAE